MNIFTGIKPVCSHRSASSTRTNCPSPEPNRLRRSSKNRGGSERQAENSLSFAQAHCIATRRGASPIAPVLEVEPTCAARVISLDYVRNLVVFWTHNNDAFVNHKKGVRLDLGHLSVNFRREGLRFHVGRQWITYG